ncbi:MAG: hypothetical protein KJ058_09885 [Thermoanaerobaculia bacterium]|nr:hypothetical protein [Thermoanaerobaculia bacterium]
MFRTSAIWFAGLLAAALAAFWPSYLSQLPAGSFYLHLHAATMTLWCLLLIAQPLLVRQRRPLHRALGRASYALVPVIGVASILLAHSRLTALDEAALAAEGKYVYLPLAAIALFLFAYAMAVRHRRSAPLHARFMVATGLTLIDPVVARLFHFYLPPLPHDLLYQVAGYGLTLAVLAWLIWRERGARAGGTAFPLLLAVFGGVYLLWFTFGQSLVWMAFVGWFRQLPLT